MLYHPQYRYWKSEISIFPFVGFVRPKAESDHNVMNPTSKTATSDLLPAKVEDSLLRLLCLLLLILIYFIFYFRTGVYRQGRGLDSKGIVVIESIVFIASLSITTTPETHPR